MDDQDLRPHRRVDVHSHLCPPDLPDFAERFGDERWPVVRSQLDGSLLIVRDGRPYRPIDERYYDHDRRTEFLDRYGLDHQVVSPLPVLLPYWAPAVEATEVCRWQNNAIATFVSARPDRYSGLGTVALQDPDGAIELLDQVADLGLLGVEIGTTYGGEEFSGPASAEFFAAAAERQVPILVHPLEGGGMGRMENQLVRFSVGVLSDTSIAAAHLLLSKVLLANPELRVCLSHGGGTFFWVLPRLRAMLRSAQGEEEADQLVAAMSRVWVDTASLGVENLQYLDGILGRDRMVIGSDFPAASATDPCAALRSHDQLDDPGICHLHAEAFLGRRVV